MSHSADDTRLQNMEPSENERSNTYDPTELPPLHQKRRVLVAVDGSKTSHKAFNVAISQTNPEDKITLYHGEYLGTALDVDGQFTAVTDENNARNSAYLKSFFMSQCQKAERDCEFVNHKISGGPSIVSKDICDVASKRNIGNIYLGSRGMSVPSRFLLGSVSWNLLNACDCSITIVKEPKAKEDETIIPGQWHGHRAIIPSPKIL